MEQGFSFRRVWAYSRLLWKWNRMDQLLLLYIGIGVIYFSFLLWFCLKVKTLDMQSSINEILFNSFNVVYFYLTTASLNITNPFCRKGSRQLILSIPVSFLEQFISFLLLVWGFYFGVYILYTILTVNVVGNIYALSMGLDLFWFNPLNVFNYNMYNSWLLAVPVALFWQALIAMILLLISRWTKLSYVLITIVAVLLFKYRAYTYVLFDYSVWLEQPISVRVLYWIAPVF
ncbi:MAG: hypothetical protein ACRDDZ_02735, partial [Marinifilaceae bacterium]